MGGAKENKRVNFFTSEEQFEDYIISLFQEAGYEYSSEASFRRDDYESAILAPDLCNFLRTQNPNLNPLFDVKSIIQLLDSDVKDNRDFLTNWIYRTTYKKPLSSTRERFSFKLLDFDNVEKNIFRIVRQFALSGNKQNRVDLVVYVNGIPLVVWEIKNPSNPETTLLEAHKQLQSYYSNLPLLFKYNAFSVVCDHPERIKYGISNSTLDKWDVWKYKKTTYDKSEGGLEVTVQSLFKKETLLDIISDYIWFSDQDPENKKICRYPQYFGTKALLESIKKHKKPVGDGKGGIFFGATGCGKSYAMLFLTKLLKKSADFHNPTIVLITDRTELNNQLHGLFNISRKYLNDNQIIKVPKSDELVEIFNKFEQGGGIILTTIHKFRKNLSKLSERNNIIVIADEAHRTHHNLNKETCLENEELIIKQSFARVLRDSLPNATYIGFTATPIDKTMDVFGDESYRYTMKESNEDGFTVILKLRLAREEIRIKEEVADKIDAIYDIELNQKGTSKKFIEFDQKERLKFHHLVENPQRIDSVAKDIVSHYRARLKVRETIRGKALIVTQTRYAAYLYYKKIKELMKNDKLDIRLIATRNQKDLEKGREFVEMYEIIGDSKNVDKWAAEFKNPESSFKIAIVCDRWLTGFDVPSLDTMYLDKWIKEHDLIQTVSRVNRTFTNKKDGLIVSYWPIEKRWEEAMKSVMGWNSDNEDMETKKANIRSCIAALNSLFKGFDKEKFWECRSESEQYSMIEQFSKKEGEGFVEKFEGLYKKLWKADNSYIGSLMGPKLEKDKSFYKLAWRYLQMPKNLKQIDPEAKSILNQNMKNLYEHIQLECVRVGKLCIGVPYMDIEKAKITGLTKEVIDNLEEISRQLRDLWSKTFKQKIQEALENLKEAYSELENRMEDDDSSISDVEQEIKEKMNEHKEWGITLEQWTFYNTLRDVQDEVGIKFDHQKMIDFSKEIDRVIQEVKEYEDWQKRIIAKKKIKASLLLWIEKNNFFDSGLDKESRDGLIEKIVQEVLDKSKIIWGND